MLNKHTALLRALPVAALVLLSAGVNPVLAQDKKDDGKAVEADIKLTSNVKRAKKKDPTNYVHFFIWSEFHDLGLSVASMTECTGEKWMIKKLKKAKKAPVEARKAKTVKSKIGLEFDIDVNYQAMTMKMDGKEALTGHKWQAKIKGTISDENGKKLKSFELKHQWACNMKVSRKRGRTEFMRHLTQWILLELYGVDAFKKTVPEANHEKLGKYQTKYQAAKKKLYDSNWK